MPSEGGFAFGPFRLDAGAKRLLRDDEPVALSSRQLALLHKLITHAGKVVSKDDLIDAAWPDTAVGDNSLEQEIRKLRVSLDPAHPVRYVETAKRVGYRFIADATPFQPRATDADIAARMAPHRAALEARAALETLQLDRVARARATYEQLLARRGDDARSHVGLASACLEQFEATRADLHPDVEALRRAESHAREAVRLNLNYADAWATLGLVLDRAGDRMGALSALRQAVELEPGDWRHHLALAWAAWGRERQSEAGRVLELMPGNPAAHWLVATVHVARNALADAERELAAGIAAMGRAAAATDAFPPIALCWLEGLLVLARGEDEQARAWFDRELAIDGSGHIYERETIANTWYAIGALELRRGNHSAAGAAFKQAVARVENHPTARAGLVILRTPGVARDPGADVRTPGVPSNPEGHPVSSVDAAMARAAVLVAGGDTPAAVEVVAAALAAAPPGNAGWLVPIEPLLGVPQNREAWTPVLAALQLRAR